MKETGWLVKTNTRASTKVLHGIGGERKGKKKARQSDNYDCSEFEERNTKKERRTLREKKNCLKKTQTRHKRKLNRKKVKV